MKLKETNLSMKKIESFLNNVCFNGKRVQLQSIFKGSDHNFRAAAFHQYCDNKGPTLSVIKSDSNRIFGGYTA